MDFLDIPDELLEQKYPGMDIQALKAAYKRNQAEKANQAESSKPVTETIKTDPTTGEQTVTISGSARDLSAANPLTPTLARPVAPAPVEEYNRYTAQQESGANPNIGYHNPQRSSAYGAYGLTAPQYQEIQRANPQFAGRDITSLSPEEQAQANTTSRDVYARQLQAKGVEPTEENIRLAHFLGAGGANQFLKSGAISPEAAAANGGEDKARQIALARLNGPVAPGQQPSPMIAGQASSDVGLTPTEQAIARMGRTPGYSQQVPQTPEEQAQAALIAAGNNPTKLYALAGNDKVPEAFRNIARDMALQQDKFRDTEKNVLGNLEDAASGNVTAANKMIKSLRSGGEEGSLTKAVLLGLIGAKSAAKDEYLKYSGQYYKTNKSTLDNKAYTVQTDPSGAIVKAYDPSGNPVDDATLAQLNAKGVAQGTHAYGFTGGSYVIPKGDANAGQEYRQRTNNITGEIENVITSGPDRGKIYTGNPGIAQSVGTQQLKMDYGVISKYREKFGTNALGALDQMQKDRGPMSREEQEAFLNAYGFQAGPPGVGGIPQSGVGGPVVPGQPQVQQPGGAPGAVRPVVPGQAPSQPSVQQPGGAPQQPGAVAPVAPGQAPQQPGQAPGSSATSLQNRAVIDQIGPMRPRGVNESESSYNVYKKTYEKTASDLAEGQAKVQLNLPQYISTADQILTNIDQVTYATNKDGTIKRDKAGNPVVSEGLKSNVGVPGITGLINIPGTEARDWRAKYKNLEAKQFMLQFEKLRGAGAITDKEGSTATAALAALQDPGISEEAFLRNAEELRDIIKVGANRQLMLAGKEPDSRYFLGDPKKSKEAYEWAKAHPNDPMASAVLEKIGLR